MKNLFPGLLAIIFVMQEAIGQITITQADMPSANDTLRYSNGVQSANLPIQQNGTNQIWDFSALSPASQDIDSYKLSLQTPYAFFFLGLNKYGKKVADTLGVAAFQFTDVYNFYKKSSAAFETEGIGLKYQGLPLPAYYSDKDEIYQFPLQFGDRDSSTFKFSLSLSTLASYSQVGFRINEVDGWGSITTPYGTFNCLKVKSTISSNDSLNISGLPLKFNRKIIEYKWLANGKKIPILEISGNVIGGSFITTAIKYRDIVRGNVLFQVPVAQFTASQTQVYLNQNVQFNNTSSGNFLSYKWEFSPSTGINYQNGTSDTSKNPLVSFSETGQYSVKLRSVNLIGQDEELKTNYITVFDLTDISTSKGKESLFEFNCKNSKIYFWAPVFIKNQALELIDISGRRFPLITNGNQIWLREQDPFIANGIYLIKNQNPENHLNCKLILGL